MDRPISPTSILNLPYEDIRELEEEQAITQWIDQAMIGFDHVREKLNKESITAADVLLIFYNFDILNDNHELFVPLFCLAICFLESCKDDLNEIEPNIYKKLFDYTTNMYTTKSQIYLENI